MVFRGSSQEVIPVVLSDASANLSEENRLCLCDWQRAKVTSNQVKTKVLQLAELLPTLFGSRSEQLVLKEQAENTN